MAFVPIAGSPQSGSIALSGATDNQGNSFVVSKFLSSKFPLCCVLMELAEQLDQRKVAFDLRWVPRDKNMEADELSDGISTKFSLAKEVRIDLSSQSWFVLSDMMSAGKSLQEAKKSMPSPGTRAGKRRCEVSKW